MIGIGVFLVAVFTVLGFWHRSIQIAEERELARKVREAEELGSSQALTGGLMTSTSGDGADALLFDLALRYCW